MFYSNDNADDMAQLIGELLVDQKVYEAWKDTTTKRKAKLRVKYMWGVNEFEITIVQTKAPSKKTLEQNRKKGMYTM